jgi:hypothetical protein
MVNQENETQYDVVIHIIQVQKMYAEGRLTSKEAGNLMAAMIEEYAETKVEQFKQEQNEVANINDQA